MEALVFGRAEVAAVLPNSDGKMFAPPPCSAPDLPKGESEMPKVRSNLNKWRGE